jgi:SpoIIAA-like
MFEVTDRSTPTCVVVEASGAVSGAEYEVFAERFENAVRDHGTVNLDVNLEGPISYGDLDAFEDDWRFAFKEYRHARRAAFVGDQHVINAVLRIVSPFTRVEEKFFPAGELDAAITWASAD